MTGDLNRILTRIRIRAVEDSGKDLVDSFVAVSNVAKADKSFPRCDRNVLAATAIASGPEIRITAIAPAPEAVANATMVSLFMRQK